MQLNQCTITEEEIKIAVAAFLKTQGVNVPIESLKKSYAGRGGYEVNFVEPEMEPAPPEKEEAS